MMEASYAALFTLQKEITRDVARAVAMLDRLIPWCDGGPAPECIEEYVNVWALTSGKKPGAPEYKSAQKQIEEGGAFGFGLDLATNAVQSVLGVAAGILPLDEAVAGLRATAGLLATDSALAMLPGVFNASIDLALGAVAPRSEAL